MDVHQHKFGLNYFKMEKIKKLFSMSWLILVIFCEFLIFLSIDLFTTLICLQNGFQESNFLINLGWYGIILFVLFDILVFLSINFIINLFVSFFKYSKNVFFSGEGIKIIIFLIIFYIQIKAIIGNIFILLIKWQLKKKT